MDESKWLHLKGTPIGEMFDKGMKDVEMGNILNCTAGAVNKWRQGANKTSELYQSRARGYLDGLALSQKEETVLLVEKEHIYVVSVPNFSKDRFVKMMTLLSLQAVDLDE